MVMLFPLVVYVPVPEFEETAGSVNVQVFSAITRTPQLVVQYSVPLSPGSVQLVRLSLENFQVPITEPEGCGSSLLQDSINARKSRINSEGTFRTFIIVAFKVWDLEYETNWLLRMSFSKQHGLS
jgi:hypothetical protein